MPSRNIAEIEFGAKAAADEARAMLPPEALAHDDARLTTLTVDRSVVDERTMDELVGMAADHRRIAAESTGQLELTDRERERIDFTETDVMIARSAKAEFTAQGVSDWIAHFDDTLRADEFQGVAADARTQGGGRRMDAFEGEDHQVQQMAQAHRRVQEEEIDHAVKHAPTDADARAFLREEAGWTDAEIQSIVEPGPDMRQPATAAEVEAVDIIRARSNGRFLEEPPQPAPTAQGNLRIPSTGRFVGDNFAHPGIGRDPQTGQFVDHGDPRPAGPYPGNDFDPDEAMGEEGWSDGQTSLFGDKAAGQATFGVQPGEHDPEAANPKGGGDEFVDDTDDRIGETDQLPLIDEQPAFLREDGQRGLFDL